MTLTASSTLSNSARMPMTVMIRMIAGRKSWTKCLPGSGTCVHNTGWPSRSSLSATPAATVWMWVLSSGRSATSKCSSL